MKYAFIFPGQGSQYPGMGKALAESYNEARYVFEEVDEALKQNLTEMMFDGSADDLNLTENTQPALMALSMAVLAVLKKQESLDLGKICTFVAGHSLGEYSALTAVDTFTIADAAKILKQRGQAMQAAVPVGIGSMAAILGMDFNDVKAITQESSTVNELCEAANDNSDGQVVVSGHKAAVEKAVKIATERGAKRAVVLPVSAPFHCSLMAPAAEKMAHVLERYDLKKPRVPVVTNVTAQEETNPDQIRNLLVKQVTGTVRWRESVLYMKEHNITHMVEIGAGKVLSGLIRRIDRSIETMAVETPEQIEKLIMAIQG